MNKFLALFFIIFLYGNTVFASDISFVYINGSNTNNEKMTNWFLKGVKKTQKDMVKAFNSSEVIQKELLRSGNRKINEKAVPFYWGDMSQAEIEYLKEDLDVTKFFTPHIAQSVRAFMAYCLHDAIWVTKHHNMIPIIKKLHKTVMAEKEKGNSVVLFGYSAGSFITMHYLFFKAPFIVPSDLFSNLNISQVEKDFIKEVQVEDTCLDALVASNLVVLNNQNSLIPNVNPELFKKNYSQLDKYTKSQCIPKGTVDGIVNFASPVPLFYSGIGTHKNSANIYNAHMLKYIIENDKFFLTVNFAEDPLGFPTTEVSKLEQFELYWGKKIKAGGGFIYDKSDIKSPRSFLSAHTSYWSASKKFSKGVVKAYEDGLEYFYKKSIKDTLYEEVLSNNKDVDFTKEEEFFTDYILGVSENDDSK